MSSHKETAIKTSYLSLIGNFALAGGKGVAGVLGNSYALIADAIESTTDVFSSFLVLFGLKYSTRPPDENHPYGHGRAEALITFVVVGFLVVAAVIIAHESIVHIQEPHDAPKPFTLIFLAIIIIIKESFFQIVNRKAKLTNSSSLKADAWHHRSDAITSVMAFIGISIALYMGKGYESADDWAALLASGFIIYNAYLIFRPALGEIMDEHSHDHVVEEIKKISITVNGIIDTEKCFVRKTGMVYFVDLHAIVNGDLSVREGHTISHELKRKLMNDIPQIANVLIHIEPDK